MMTKKGRSLFVGLTSAVNFLYAQQVNVNTIGKDPFNGKALEVVYKNKEGEWKFQSFSNTIVKTTFIPAGYSKGEQISDAVITKPQPIVTKVTAGISPTVEFENQTKVVIQRDKFYYKLGNEVKVKAASYFAQGDNRGFKFQLSDNEKFFGGGERALPMDRRGHRFNLYNIAAYGYGLGADNLNFSVPVIISSNGYAIFFDNPSKGYLDIGLTDKNTLECGFVSGELTYYVVFGKNMDEILRNYTALTGRQPLPARWVFGNFVSRFGYRSEEQVRGVVKKMREDKFPMDAVIFDLFWFGDSIQGTLGNLDWNIQKWPNPKKMIDDFKKIEGLNSILITEPFVLKNTKTYNEAIPFLATDADKKPFTLTDFYFGEGGVLDVFRKPSQDFFWKYYKKQIENGVAGWWGDLGEPEKHPNLIHHNLKDYGVERLMTADEVHNAYGHYWSKMLFEKYAQNYSDTRLFHLNRAGFAGSQRYSIFPWTGDVSRNWSGLKAQLPVLLGMSLSGLPYVHSDAGGFAMTDESDPELYTRWLQFAAFTPVFRPHGTALEELSPPNVKSIPSEPCFWDEPYKSIVRNYINLRYQLLPYNYTLAYEQAVYGKPLMRPLSYYNFGNADAYKAEDQYFWGDNFLIAPVLNKDATARMLYLPEGSWYNFTNNDLVAGNKWITEKTDINSIPVFVKEGSFVPMWLPKSEIRSTADYSAKDITVRYYPSVKKTKYELYDDDGISTKTLEKSQYEVLTFNGNAGDEGISIKITTNNELNYRRKQTRKFEISVPLAEGMPVAVKINGKALPAEAIKANNYGAAKARFISFPVEYNGKEMTVEIN